MPTFLQPLAALSGPQFLAVYGAAILSTLAAVWTLRWFSDSTRSLPPPAVPPNPDPYELAWLRGGDAEVLRLAVFSLLERGLLEKSDGDRIGQATVNQEGLNSLLPLEQALFEHFAVPQSAREFFRGSMPFRVREACETYERRMVGEQLLLTNDIRVWRVLTSFLGGLLIVSVGAFKLVVALSRHKHNVGFLIVMAVVACVVLVVLAISGRLSARGESYLQRLRLAFAGLKQSAETPRPEGIESRYDPNVLLYAGLFGIGALGSAYLLGYRELFPRLGADAGSSGWSGGSSSCGSASSGCGSSCGSGCGSGCGGGGGCGGCGGGGD